MVGIMSRVFGLLTVALVVTACSFPITNIVENDTEITIRYGGGGLLSKKLKLYAPLYETCKIKQCKIDGMMISADAFYAFGLPGVCYTHRAVWSPHAISAMGVYRLAAETENITLYLPEPLANHFRASLWYWDFITARDINYEELLTIWPDGACT